MSGHSATVRETVAASSAEMNCASAFKITGSIFDFRDLYLVFLEKF